MLRALRDGLVRRIVVLVACPVLALPIVGAQPAIAGAGPRHVTTPAKRQAASAAVNPTFKCDKAGDHPVSAHVGLSGLRRYIRKTGTGAGTSLTFELRGVPTFGLHLDFSGSITCTATKQLAFPIADTGLQLRLGPDFTFKANGAVAGDFTWSPFLDYGFTLDRHGFSHEIHVLKSSSDVSFTGTGQATLRLALAADVGRSEGGAFNVGVGGDIGPTLTVNVNSSSADASTCWSVTGLGVAKLTAHAQVLKWIHKTWTLVTKSFGRFSYPRHCIGATGGGTESAWGYGFDGELGDGQTYNSGCYCVRTPVNVSALLHVVTIASGSDAAYALQANGNVWAWGNGADGALGAATQGTTNVPVQISGLSSVTTIAGGQHRGLAVRTDGTVWAWGDGSSGGLGNGQLNSSTQPVQVSGLSGVKAVAAGVDSYALKADGTVWAWGADFVGGLGDGNSYSNACTCSDVPVQVSGLTGVIAITSSDQTAYALKSDGTVWAWGNGQLGELGSGPTDGSGCNCSNTPVQVPGLTNAVSIASGYNDGYAVKSDGTAVAWGFNSVGQLGNGQTDSTGCACSTGPVTITGLSNVKALAANSRAAYAVKADGTIWSWGSDQDGELGAGDSVIYSSGCACADSPVQVVGLTGATSIAGGGFTGYALLQPQ